MYLKESVLQEFTDIAGLENHVTDFKVGRSRLCLYAVALDVPYRVA